jgi:hypothetical protein
MGPFDNRILWTSNPLALNLWSRKKERAETVGWVVLDTAFNEETELNLRLRRSQGSARSSF